MTMQGELFDFDEGGRRKEDALARVTAGANSDWKSAAFEAVRKTAENFETFIVDDVWGHIEPGHATRDNRAMGPVMLRAQAAKIIASTDFFSRSRRVTCHQSPRRVWRSLVFKE